MKLPIKICLSALICVLGTACNESNDEPTLLENEVPPIAVNKEISSYFDENVDKIVKSIIYVENDVLGSLGSLLADSCVMINSVDELPKVFIWDNVPFDYPFIDFDSYTLVLGQYLASGVNILHSQRFIVEDDSAAMLLTTEWLGGVDAVLPRGFWGLYPKLPKLPIDVNPVVD